jgi:hypothetical protein
MPLATINNLMRGVLYQMVIDMGIGGVGKVGAYMYTVISSEVERSL